MTAAMDVHEHGPSNKEGIRQQQFFVELANLRVEQSEGRGQSGGVHFQWCKHLPELPAGEVIRKFPEQPLGLFNGSKKRFYGNVFCIHTKFPWLEEVTGLSRS